MMGDLLPEDQGSKESNNQEAKELKKIPAPRDWNIQEVENTLDEEDATVEKAGVIEHWYQQDTDEKQRMRLYLTYSTIPLWITWTLSGLIEYLLTGNSFLLATSSPMGLLLLTVFRYYFSR